jgi:hypothetical protein
MSKEEVVVKDLIEYYLPQLKFSMKSNYDYAMSLPEDNPNRKFYLGAYNAFETCIGCIEEALEVMNEEKEDE